MGVHKYSHSFTRVQLQLIIDDYLGLGPYYKILHRQLREYVRRVESQEESVHSGEKAHPIKIYTKDYLSRNFQDCEATQLHIACESPKCDIRTTYSSVVAKYYYIYPLEVVVEVLESEDYYRELPKNIIINHLLTTENLQIIIETLTILSEEMSKKIKTTLAGKDVRKAQLLSRQEEQKKDEEDFFQIELPVIQEEPEATLPQSKIDIPQENLFDEEEELPPRKISKKRTFNPLVRTEMASNVELRMGQVQKRCSYCQSYLLYLSETNGEGFGDDCLNKLSKQAIKYLKVIAQTVTHFTLFLMENNLTQVPNNIHTLNRVLNTIGIVITEDIFNSELNPKNRKAEEITYPKPRNLIEHLVPFFSSIEVKQKQVSKEVYAIDELFRMVIYCPTVEEVTLQLQNFQVEQFEREDSVLKSVENEEKVRALLRKEFNYIREYENERLLISKNTINNKPIYRQLQFEEEKLPPQSTQPQNYNVNTSPPTSRIKTANSSKHPFDRNQTTPLPTHSVPSFKKQNKSLLIELTQSISHNFKNDHSEDAELKKFKADKNKFKKIQQRQRNDNADTFSNNLKKNLIKNNQNTAQEKSSCQQAQQISLSLLKPPTLDKQAQNQLSESDFRKLIYCTFAKNQGFTKPEPMGNMPSPSHTAPNLNNYLNSSLSRSTIKKNNGYSSSLTQFIGRKQEEEHIECMEKLEKETYNRQLLNGEFVRNQIYEEINLGAVKVYDNYANACGLVDTLRLEEFTTEDPMYRNQASDSASSRRKLLRSCSRGKSSNVIEQNSTKYNQSGIIRNQKYNKSIKSELINHRQSYLRNVDNQNLSKMHLAQTSKLKKVGSKNQAARTIKDLYNQQLRRRLEDKDRSTPHYSNFEELQI